MGVASRTNPVAGDFPAVSSVGTKILRCCRRIRQNNTTQPERPGYRGVCARRSSVKAAERTTSSTATSHQSPFAPISAQPQTTAQGLTPYVSTSQGGVHDGYWRCRTVYVMNRASGVAVGALTVVALSAAAFGALSFADHSEDVDRTPTTQLPLVTSVSTTPPTSAAPSPTTSSTAAVTPAPADVTPVGPCDSSTVEQLGYRNITGNTPDAMNQIGQSERGRPIMAEHWGRATGPQVLVVGQVHGNE